MGIRVVLDSNIWISYIIQGKMTDIVAMATVGNVEFVRCEELTTEISEVLARPKFEKYLKEPLSSYIALYERITTPIKISSMFSGCRDPKDNFLFDLAYQSKAKYLVSGDNDIVETPVVSPLEVVSLARFREIYIQRLN